MINLVIDVGNTRLKYAFFEKGSIKCIGYDVHTLKATLDGMGDADIVALLSGSGDMSLLKGVCLSQRCDYVFFFKNSSSLKLPISILYDTPLTLGTDRISDAVGAASMFPGKEIMIIDAGTAITYDYVSSRQEFIGGNISPGLDMRFRSLYDYTQKLPYLGIDNEEVVNISVCGSDTESAIKKGVFSGIYRELKGYEAEFMQRGNQGVIVFTGGNYWLGKVLNYSQVALEPLLGLKGLNVILEYNL